jgi:phosphatidylserine/phosphatidylglycerophosphate/cardiolipin synthase-like enzyme
MPMSQNALLGVKQEENFIQELLLYFEKMNRSDATISNNDCKVKEVFFATAYFNPSLSIYDAIFRVKAEKYSFLTSSKEANSFFGAPWPKGIVPYYYERLYHYMMKRAAKSTIKKPDILNFFRYCRPGWTFHAKEFSVQTENELLTTIGSSNFGGRSHTRDSELTCFVWTDSQDMIRLVDSSRQKMLERSKKSTLEEAQKAKGRKFYDWLLDILKFF